MGVVLLIVKIWAEKIAKMHSLICNVCKLSSIYKLRFNVTVGVPAMAKGHQAYRDSWATFLAKNALPEGSWQWVNFSLMKTQQRSVHSETWSIANCRVLLMQKYKRKIILKQIQRFHEIFHQRKFPAI